MRGRLVRWLILLPVCSIAPASCQVLSGVNDLDIVSDPDAAAGRGESNGAAGISGSSGSAGFETGGTSGSTGAAGTLGGSGAGGTDGSRGTDASGGTNGASGSAGTEGSAGAAGSGAVGGTGGTAGTGATGGTGGSAGSGGAPPECDDSTDCPGEGNPCARRACTNGRCALEPEPDGTATANQTAGDCKKNVCNGSGSVVSVNDNNDPRDDGNACTRNICNNGVPSNPPEPVNTPCGVNTKCDGAGRCVGCTAHTDCPADTPCTDWSCNTSGQCASAPKPATTPCGPAPTCTPCTNPTNCSSDIEYPQDYCDGAGACRDSGSKACSPLTCGTTACRASCTLDSHCTPGHYCGTSATETGTCRPKKTLGESCGGTSQCTTGFCVDGVCCENACSGLCRTCSGTQAGGLPSGYCWPVAAMTDPASECAGGRACNGAQTGNPGCTGVTQCDCTTPRHSQYENCCSNCGGQSDCPSQIGACNAAHGVPCTAIGNIDGYRSGTGVSDQSCVTGLRCAILTCTCVQ